jgi:hypothetical protein
LPKIHRFSAKSQKARTVPYLKLKPFIVLIDLFQKHEPFCDYLKTNQSKKKALALTAPE